MGNLWQGVVAERMGYSTALYLDALFVIAALVVIPFLKNREDKTAAISLEPAMAVGR
jgi:predicted MFS family arabinose efflux permease